MRAFIKDTSKEKLWDDAQQSWLDMVCARDPQMISAVEYECCSDVRLAQAYYAALSEYVESAPSLEREDGWVKVSGLVFEIPNATTLAPIVVLTEQQRADLEASLSICPTLSNKTFPGKIRVSSFGVVFSEHASDWIIDEHMLALEATLSTDWRPDFGRLPYTSHEGRVRIFVLALLEMPWTPGVESWEDFDFEVCGELERIDLRPVTLFLPQLSYQPAMLAMGGDAMFVLGRALFENDATERIEDQVIAVLNTIKRPDQRIELEVKRNEEFDSPIQQFDVWCRLSDNSGVVEEQLLFTTISPAFAIGWFVYVLNVLCGPGQIDMQKGQLTQHERAGLLTQ